MKNYSIKEKNKNNSSTYITDFQFINETDMKIYMADGSNIVVPISGYNVEKVRNIMKEQAKKAVELLPSKKRKSIGFRALTAAGVVGMVLVNTTDFGKEINPILSNASLGGVTLLSAAGSIKNSKLIDDIRKLNLFIRNEDVLNNSIANNPYVYANIPDKDIKKLLGLIETNEQPLTIEQLDQISYTTLKTIWNNIKLGQQLEMSYGSNDGFQKVKKSNN